MAQPIILISVRILNPTTFRLGDEAEQLRLTTQSMGGMTILGMQESSIAGYPAWQMTTRVDPRPHLGQREIMVDDVVLWPAGERYYRFSLWVPEDQREGPYGRAFDQLIASVELVP
ncbi:MAG: hypothetical protein A2Z66_00510 [Chloroflexi bacterium RBG_13_66_10]|nr:MAG: hypothetical protein A2Z66_00510 [Chloroflexi bacterium RBG_13_66_10]